MVLFLGEYRNYLLITVLCFISRVGFSDGQQLDCGRRAPEPEALDNDAPPYGEFGWDNPQLAKREDFPWHVSIFRRPRKPLSFKYECGGTLIPGPGDDLLILTSAKCVTENLNSTQPGPLNNFRVVIGPTSSNYNKNLNDLGSQKFALRRIEINPLYEVKTYDADAAILQVDGEIQRGKYAYPACLPPKHTPKMGVIPGMTGEIAGFGWDTRRNVTESLRYARYPLAQSIMCQERLSVKVNDYLEFCAGYERDATACQGDIGGGLVFRHPKIGGRYFVQGILSNLDISPISNEGYCENFNVFQRVGPYLEWIKQTQDRIANEVEIETLPTPRPTSGGALNYIPEFAKIARDFHNHFRRMHNAPPVRLVAKLQDEALKLAAELVEEDDLSVPDEFPYSANLYVIPRLVPAQEAVREAVQYWYRGFTKYDRNNPRPSAFTQMVWKSSTQLGVGVATDGTKTVVVVDYWPKGNVLYPGAKVYERMKSFSDNVSVIPKGY